MADFVWTAERIARLEELRRDGVTTGEIAAILNVTRNAVTGKAHRLGLDPRPSPIKVNPHSPKRRRKKTYDILSAEKETTTCCWPIGHPGEQGFRFCANQALARKPYCSEHYGTAYPTSKIDPSEEIDRSGVGNRSRADLNSRLMHAERT